MSISPIKESSLFISLLLFSIFFQFDFYELPNGSTVKFYHIFIPIIAMLIFIRSRFFILKNDVTFFILLALLVNTYKLYMLGGNFIIFQALYCLLVYYIASDIGIRIDTKKLYVLLKRILFVFILAILIKDLIYIDELSRVYATNQHSLIGVYFFIGGGHNIEVTYLSLLTIFFIYERRVFYFSVVIIFILSLIYLSRIGIIEVAFLTYLRMSLFFSIKKKLVISVLMIFFVLVIISVFNNITIIHRMLHAFDELEVTTNGRGMLWFAGFQLLKTNLTGYGIGNSVIFARELIGINFVENNFHNVILQYFLDMGLVPLLLYLYIFLNRLLGDYVIEFRKFLILFFVVSLFQFTGYDIIFWFFLGIGDGLYYQRNVQYIKMVLGEDKYGCNTC
ncbi:O-antigen ligase family protein [Vibrio spartinae]|uniref:Lipid A core-O-antigen ligase n=1 Tax=Vibrio spartinae TaxID=1918945 RepID=A0ABX6QUX9_9VIBR|nr:O-antigen ligase family protein [Vibrio spartinae]QMV13005.1 Lipid A core - O-antigen ligase [Vibrio spartinae]